MAQWQGAWLRYIRWSIWIVDIKRFQVRPLVRSFFFFLPQINILAHSHTSFHDTIELVVNMGVVGRTNCQIYMLKNDAVKMWCVNLIDSSIWFYRLGCPLFRRVVLVMSYVVLLCNMTPRKYIVVKAGKILPYVLTHILLADRKLWDSPYYLTTMYMYGW